MLDIRGLNYLQGQADFGTDIAYLIGRQGNGARRKQGEGTMEEALREFIRAGKKLEKVWDEEKVKSYPNYLPSFDEFLFDFEGLMIGLEDV
jgi:hypothetical protein